MATISKEVIINAPVKEVFTYFARPEHISEQFPKEIGMNVIPIEVKDGFGVGTVFRITGNFGGKVLEWDCETLEYIPGRKIVAKQIDGPFKKWMITVEFEALGEDRTRTRMTVDYDLPLSFIGSIMDKVKVEKEAERGIENGLYRVKALLEGTGSIPVYITLDAYRRLLKVKESMNCSVSEAIVRLIEESKPIAK
ncbi:MAG: SRPBCC family protein [Candidatus Nitrosocaldus sp.]|nr:SRPBCC family protein [Candidatus Nitrosocaldus sp.]MDW8000142.1 SRPBCC family protein [Candidatus Nitrosocaldus sp.]